MQSEGKLLLLLRNWKQIKQKEAVYDSFHKDEIPILILKAF